MLIISNTKVLNNENNYLCVSFYLNGLIIVYYHES